MRSKPAFGCTCRSFPWSRHSTGADSCCACLQACGTMFLLLGGAWTKVGQPMLNVLQLVRLWGLHSTKGNLRRLEACELLPGAELPMPCIRVFWML